MNSIALRNESKTISLRSVKERKKQQQHNTGKQVQYIDFWVNYTFKKRNKRSDYADGVRLYLSVISTMRGKVPGSSN